MPRAAPIRHEVSAEPKTAGAESCGSPGRAAESMRRVISARAPPRLRPAASLPCADLAVDVRELAADISPRRVRPDPRSLGSPRNSGLSSAISATRTSNPAIEPEPDHPLSPSSSAARARSSSVKSGGSLDRGAGAARGAPRTLRPPAPARAARATTDRSPARRAGRAARRPRSGRRGNRAPADPYRRRPAVAAAGRADRGRDRRSNSSIDWFWQTRQRSSWLKVRARASSAGIGEPLGGLDRMGRRSADRQQQSRRKSSRRIISCRPIPPV